MIDMTTDALARVMYDVYSRHKDRPTPPWGALTEDRRRTWIAAARDLKDALRP